MIYMIQLEGECRRVIRVSKSLGFEGSLVIVIFLYSRLRGSVRICFYVFFVYLFIPS
jgi:hypothetical protein